MKVVIAAGVRVVVGFKSHCRWDPDDVKHMDGSRTALHLGSSNSNSCCNSQEKESPRLSGLYFSNFVLIVAGVPSSSWIQKSS